MILDGAKMKKILYQDSRGHFGEPGQLYIYTAPDSKKYLVKHKPLDVANEYISHQIAKLIGVPTSDAVLIKENDNLSVGIEYEADFQRASMNDFYGTEKYEHDDIPIFFGGTATYIKPVEVTKAKYADDDPLLAEAMAYLAFRYLVVMDDNIQVAFAHGNLISFDYAYAFNLTEESFDGMAHGNELYFKNVVGNLNRYLSILHGYKSSLELLRRPNTDRLFDAYFDPILNFHDTDFSGLFTELRQVFPKMVVDFYAACFQIINQQIAEIIDDQKE